LLQCPGERLFESLLCKRGSKRILDGTFQPSNQQRSHRTLSSTDGASPARENDMCLIYPLSRVAELNLGTRLYGPFFRLFKLVALLPQANSLHKPHNMHAAARKPGYRMVLSRRVELSPLWRSNELCAMAISLSATVGAGAALRRTLRR
jgi:hypothetical protein